MATPTKLEILKGMSFGNPVAEDEQEALARYFVETNTWDEIYKGQVDVVYGSKGSGKSAIYLLIQSYSDALFDKGILLVPAEEIRGAPAFSDLVTDPPASDASLPTCGSFTSLLSWGGQSKIGA